MLIATLYDTNNSDSSLILSTQDIAEFSYHSDFNNPTDKLLITFKNSSAVNLSYSNIKLTVDNALIFDGFIIKQSICESIIGSTIKITAFSKAYILIKRFADPQMFNNLSLTDFFNQYISPLGFKLKIPDSEVLSSSLPSFTILPKTNLWSALKIFIERSLNCFPFILNNQYIMTSNHFPRSNLSISNSACNLGQALNSYSYSHLSLTTINEIDNILNKDHSSSPHLSLTIPDIVITQAGYKISAYDKLINKYITSHNFVIKQIYVAFKNSSFCSHLILFPSL